MRVVSWNVNGIRAGVRHGFVDFVDRSGADIVGVQEVRAQPEDIPPAARRPPGWHTAFTVAERRGYSGVGLYSKLQPVRVDTSLGVPRFDREGRFMAGHFQTARGRFVVVNSYFPKGSGPARDNSRVGYKLDFSRTVFARAQELRCLRRSLLVMWTYPLARKGAYASASVTGAILDCNLLHRKVLMSHYQQRMAQAPPAERTAAVHRGRTARTPRPCPAEGRCRRRDVAT